MSPKVFVNYSHEDSEHNQWVLDLSAILREKGVDASLDQWDLGGGGDITFFMESKIRDSNFVILICTPTYAEKSNIPKGGVGYEKNIISAEMLQARDLGPKFIPILRKGTLEDALPTYLGSKYAIDFRDSRVFTEAMDELLRVIYKQPHPTKPPLGANPFEKGAAGSAEVVTSSIDREKPTRVWQDIDIWEKKALGRFDYLRSDRLDDQKEDPFKRGFWQASFVLIGNIPPIGLTDFLKILRASETGRTGWDVGWVPTRGEIAPYPYQEGIEVWLAENGDKGPSTSDFWRAEPTGRFSLFRGYQEDEESFSIGTPGRVLDFPLVLWRVSEFLLYIESFAKQMNALDAKSVLKLTWRSLNNRQIGHHKNYGRTYENHTCRQNTVSSPYEIETCREIKQSLIHDVHQITQPLFESFNFFSLTEEQIKQHIKKLFDPEKET